MKTGRNDPCPCGSGKKYKQCCAGKTSRKELLYSKGLLLLGVLFVVLAVGGVVAAFYSSDSSGADTRVWSAEHGHWH